MNLDALIDGCLIAILFGMTVILIISYKDDDDDHDSGYFQN
jgi:hypothetical protein